MTDIEKIRARLASGELMDGDLSWCKQRINALKTWPDPLTYEQQTELVKLKAYLEAYA